jgi:hypothetical protein
MKSWIAILILIFLFPISANCAITKEFGPYYGKLIDAETQKPIEGAAVLVVFYTEEYGPAGAISHYADAVETVTNKNGEFKIPEQRITLFRPLQGWMKHGYLTIFKPGYGCYPNHKDVKPMFVPNGSLPEDKQVIIELPRLKTIQEKLESTMCSPSSDIPTEKCNELINLINQERSSLGYKPIR